MMAATPLQILKSNSSVIVSGAGKACNAYMGSLYKGSAAFGRICIVTTSKPASKFVESLQKQNIDLSKFLFIDCVDPKHVGKDKCHCIHIGSVESLTNISLTMKKVVKTKKFDLIVIDNISGILLYNSDVVAAKFIHDIVDSLRDTKVKFAASILKKDMKGSLQELGLFVDKVVEA